MTNGYYAFLSLLLQKVFGMNMFVVGNYVKLMRNKDYKRTVVGYLICTMY